MTDQPDKLDLRSHDVAEDKRQELNMDLQQEN